MFYLQTFMNNKDVQHLNTNFGMYQLFSFPTLVVYANLYSSDNVWSVAMLSI